jgi:hypothetical protein
VVVGAPKPGLSAARFNRQFDRALAYPRPALTNVRPLHPDQTPLYEWEADTDLVPLVRELAEDPWGMTLVLNWALDDRAPLAVRGAAETVFHIIKRHQAQASHPSARGDL